MNCHLDRSVPGFPATLHWTGPRVRLSVRERRMKCTNATKFHRKSGVAQWRDLQCAPRASRIFRTKSKPLSLLRLTPCLRFARPIHECFATFGPPPVLVHKKKLPHSAAVREFPNSAPYLE